MKIAIRLREFQYHIINYSHGFHRNPGKTSETLFGGIKLPPVYQISGKDEIRKVKGSY